MNEKAQQVEIGIVIILLAVAFYLGYNYATSEYKIQTEELNKIKQEYAQLNESYNQLTEDYKKLEAENKMLRSQQKQLTEEIASYLIEQTAIDLFGLKKYEIAYNLVKITICNKNPTVIFC